MPALVLPPKDCPLCPRLAAFREENRQKYPAYYNGAVPPFGSLDASVLIVGLAPGLQGANATGRPFTGDFAGDVLYPALVRHGLAVQSSESRIQSSGNQSDKFRGRGDFAELRTLNSDLSLTRCRITNAVRCVPPQNMPETSEIRTCNRFLQNEIAAMPSLRVILTLGLVSHKAVLSALGLKQSALKFTHGAMHSITRHRELRDAISPGLQSHEIASSVAPSRNDDIVIANSYHTSRYNLNTGVLTLEMFDAVIGAIATHLEP